MMLSGGTVCTSHLCARGATDCDTSAPAHHSGAQHEDVVMKEVEGEELHNLSEVIL